MSHFEDAPYCPIYRVRTPVAKKEHKCGYGERCRQGGVIHVGEKYYRVFDVTDGHASDFKCHYPCGDCLYTKEQLAKEQEADRYP